MSGATTPRCSVCGDLITDDNSALCNTCGNPFHLRLRQDAEGPDCGDV